ncbi:hypothetical protein CDEST_05694 [Colletotrichum destructivum]|uniref:F-box domain-containing protein n=1 Tax=Colletotrichum destructivum TaxID=34406 RepID=A0AAX4IB96_9PEZI|nr:hypothetical protein CDEST_05694 [Colletotrichum destructivum]
MFVSRMNKSTQCVSAFFLALASQASRRPQSLSTKSFIIYHSQSSRTIYNNMAPSWSSPPRYSRIRLVHTEDFEAAYPVLASYAVDPELALTVKELAIDTDRWPTKRSCHCGLCGGHVICSIHEPAKPVDTRAHSLLENRIRNLGLSPEGTEDMIAAMAWKMRLLLGLKPDKADGVKKLATDYASAVAVLLLSFCRNITHLYYGEISGWCYKPVEEILYKSNYGLISQEHRVLQNLESAQRLCVSEADDERHYYRTEYLDMMRLFHRLPKFSRLILDGTGEYQAYRLTFPPGSGSAPIKTIEMRHTDIDGSMLASLLRITRGLENFTISIGGLWSTDGGSPMIGLRNVSRALLTHKATLKSLDLDIEHAIGSAAFYFEDEDEDEEESEDLESERDEWFLLDAAVSSGPLDPEDMPLDRDYGRTIGSLHDFPALTRLSINIQALIGVGNPFGVRPHAPYKLVEQPPFRLIDALPPNLEFLCLYGYVKGFNDAVDDHVRELMERRGERLPNLKEVVGVDKEVVGEGSRYEVSPREGGLWTMSRPETGWVEIEQ